MLDYQPNDGAQALDQQQQLDWQRGYQVINADSGSNLVSASSSGGLAVDVAGGDILAGGSTVSCAPVTDLALPAADADQPRTDVIYRDAVGDVQVKRGVPGDISPGGVQARDRDAAAPSPYPMHDIDGVVLATVWVADGAASITSADIRDRRLPATLSVDQIAASSVVADTMDANTISTEKATVKASSGRNKTVEHLGRDSGSTSLSVPVNSGFSQYLVDYFVYIDSTTGDISMRFNGDGSGTGDYEYWDATGSRQASADDILLFAASDNFARGAGTVSVHQRDAQTDNIAVSHDFAPLLSPRISGFSQAGARLVPADISSIDINLPSLTTAYMDVYGVLDR
jgi:hypothetical protein